MKQLTKKMRAGHAIPAWICYISTLPCQICGTGASGQLVQWPGPDASVPLPRSVPALSSTVKDQNVQLTIEASRRIRERSMALVRESSALIATAISLGDDARAACGQSKPKTSLPKPQKKRTAGWRQCGGPKLQHCNRQYVK